MVVEGSVEEGSAVRAELDPLRGVRFRGARGRLGGTRIGTGPAARASVKANLVTSDNGGNVFDAVAWTVAAVAL